MKKVLLIIFLPALIVAGGVGGLLFLDSSPIVPVIPKCGLTIGDALAKENTGDLAESSWQVYRYGGDYADPSVNVVAYPDDVAAEIDGRVGCELSVVDLPPENASGTDWRIGKVAKDLKPFLGKVVRVTFRLKSDSPLELASGAVYTYDGKNVSTAPVTKLDETWHSFEIVTKVSEKATAMELWFRLFLGPPSLRPNDPKIYMSGEIDFASEEERTRMQSDVQISQERPNDGQIASAKCPIVSSQEFRDAAGPAFINDWWQVYRWNGESKAPDVKVSLAENAGPAGETICRLSYSNGPETPQHGIDWRIGNIAPLEGLVGKTVTFSVDFRADRNVKLGSSYIYTYLGGPIGSDLVKEIGPEWKTKSVTMDVEDEATASEFWYRLVFDKGTISPSEGVIDFIPRLRIEN